MGNKIDITLRAIDQTGNAFQTAEQRLQRFGRVQQAQTRAILSGTNVAGGLLTGNLGGFGAFAQSLGRIGPTAGAVGAVAGAGIGGFQLGKHLDERFGIHERIAAFFTGVEAASIRSSKSMMDKRQKDYAAEKARERAIDEADFAKRQSEIKAGGTGPGAELEMIKLSAERDRKRASEEVADVEKRLGFKRAELADVNKEVLPDLNKQRELGDEIARLTQDLESAKDISAKVAERIELDMTAAIKQARKEVETLTDQKEVIKITADIQEAQLYLNELRRDIANTNRLLTAYTDPRFKKAFRREGLQRIGQEKVFAAQDKLVELDRIVAEQAADRDPAVKRERRETERQRRHIENAIERARERMAAGRPLNAREQRLIDRADTAADLARKAADARKKENEIFAKQQELTRKQMDKAAADVAEINRKLTTLLQAAGG